MISISKWMLQNLARGMLILKLLVDSHELNTTKNMCWIIIIAKSMCHTDTYQTLYFFLGHVHTNWNSSYMIVQEVIEELQIYLLSYDRAGYGESDPHPSRTVKSEAFDIQELADKLQIGPKFYVIGFSLGGYAIWSCLKYIPHRLSGASLVVPFVHYWWPRIPASLSEESFKRLLLQDQWCFRVAHHAPWLFNWWMTQKWFPSLSAVSGNMAIFSQPDLDMLDKLSKSPSVGQEKVRQQGVHESLHRDIIAAYAEWEFDPTEIENPWPNNEGSAQIWQGCEDKIIPYKMNRFISQKLSWIRYHEVPGRGHLLPYDNTLLEAILRELVLGSRQ